MSERVWVVRHGETEWSRSGRHTGRQDVALTPRGEEGARALAAPLAGPSFAAVFTSPLRRARDTCRLAGFGDRAEALPELVEWDYGAYEGRTSDEIRVEVPGWSIWREGVRGGEAVEDVGARADRVLARLDGVAGDALVFAHGHLLRILAARWLGLAPRDGRLLALDPAGVGVLGHERGVRALRRWNLPAEAAGAP